MDAENHPTPYCLSFHTSKCYIGRSFTSRQNRCYRNARTWKSSSVPQGGLGRYQSRAGSSSSLGDLQHAPHAANVSISARPPTLTQGAPKTADGPVPGGTLCPRSARFSLGTVDSLRVRDIQDGDIYTWLGVGVALTVVSLEVLLPYHVILGHPPKCHKDTSVPCHEAGSALLRQPNTPCPGCSSSKRTSHHIQRTRGSPGPALA